MTALAESPTNRTEAVDWATLIYVVVLVATTIFSVVWLAIGAAVAAADNWPTLHGLLTTDGGRWAEGLLAQAAADRSEPLGQATLDYAFSALNIALAIVLLTQARGGWVARLMALAMIGSAGAFNLQAHAAAAAVRQAFGMDIGVAHQVQLHGVACAAYIIALLLFPSGRWERDPRSTSGNLIVVLAAAITLIVVGVVTVLVRHTITCILFFGFTVPLVGVIVLFPRISSERTAELRTKARLLSSTLVGALGTIVVLGLVTVLLMFLHQQLGLTLVDPTAGAGAAGQPTALLFWFSRLAAVGIASAALVTTHDGELWFAERVFSRGLASVLVVVLVGAGWIITHAVIARLSGEPTAWSSILATAVSSVTFLPLYLRVERLVERLLYGQRPTPYRVLADVAALSGSRASVPDLAVVAEAIGKALGSRSCQITVLRPGLRDRTYAWDVDSGPSEWADSAIPPGDHLVLPIRQGNKQIGGIAVERGGVVGLQNERHHLLEDIADSLGATLQASRLGIELERQLRAALAHGEEIAQSRRQAVAEMDSERRTIERDLHDGAQHHLVTLRLALGLAEHEVSSGQLVQARERIEQLIERLTTTEDVLAQTATGVSSIELAKHGLVAALRADLAGTEPPVLVDAHSAESLRFPPDIESAVYFCCLESVNNARKHAAGAAITVRITVAHGTLGFIVRDEGRGFTPGSVSSGRGLRNLTARITAVGGSVTIDSAPGAGTTVRGSVQLPEQPRYVDPPTDPSLTLPASSPPDSPASQPTPAPRISSTLLAQVHDIVDDTLRLSAGRPESARLEQLRARLVAPLRVGVVAPPGAETSTLIAALSATVPPGMSVLDTSAASDQDQLDMLVVLLSASSGTNHGTSDATNPLGSLPRSVPALGVLTHADEICGEQPETWDDAVSAASACRNQPEVRRRCQQVVPVAGRLARAATELSDDDYNALSQLSEHAGDPAPDAALLDRFGLFGVRLAVGLLRDGGVTDRRELANELVRLSGLALIRDTLAVALTRRAEAIRARSAMAELDLLLRNLAPAAEPVLYRLEQLKLGTHELAEIELSDTLASGMLLLTDTDLQAAERLLGTVDSRPAARLGLPDSATAEEIRQALTRELAHWRELALHPAHTRSLRDAAEILTRTCESLLAHIPDGDVDPTHRVAEAGISARGIG